MESTPSTEQPQPSGAFTVSLNQSSIVNTHTGEVNEPGELLIELRKIAKDITNVDQAIEVHKSELKFLREEREKHVSAMMDRINTSEVQTLPLFAAADAAADDASSDG